MYGQIYLITNLVNEKYYVGQTVQTLEQRWTNHVFHSKRGKTAINAAIRKYGSENFIIQQLSEAETQEDLDILERLWIILLDSIASHKLGYNLSFGGSGTGIRTEEANQKLSETMKTVMLGNKNGVGRKLTSENIAKMAAARKYEFIPWNKGLTKDDDPRLRRMSELATKQLTGLKQSAETIEKRVSKVRGIPRPNVAKLTEVQVLEILARKGKKQRALAQEFNVSETTISNIINGKAWTHLNGVFNGHT